MNNLYEKDEAGEFPAGMKVMVVDDDQQSMTLHKNVLTQFAYDVTTCSQAKDALKLLREKKGSFDLVFVDVNIPDMNCFTLLKHIKEELNLPTIMMLGDDNDNRSTIRQGVAHGACDFVIIPMNKDHVKIIWHHAERKKYFENQNMSHSEDESTNSAITTTKRPRFVWTEDRKQNFENAIKLIGLEKARPKTILPLMNDSEMTRSNVASHLQKYRFNLLKSEQNDGARSPRVPPIPNQSPGQPIMLQSSQCPMQKSRSHLPPEQAAVFDPLTISQPNNSDYYRSNESIARASNTRMNMQSDSTQSTNIPFTSYANNNCNLPPRYYSNLMPIPELPGEDVSDIGPLSQLPTLGNLGGDANNVGSSGGDSDSRESQS